MAITPKVFYRGVVSPPTYQWVQRTLPVSAAWTPNASAYGAGLFVVVQNSGFCYTSPDGITWTQRTMPSASSWSAVTYGNGTFVAIATGSTAAATSPDGITWTARTLPVSQVWNAVTYGAAGGFMAVGNGTAGALSTNGTTWVQKNLVQNVNWGSVAYGNGTYVVTGASGAAMTSTDGTTWTQRTLPAGYNAFTQTVFGGGVFLTIASGFNVAATSTDAITWTQRTMPATQTWLGLAYGGGLFTAVGGNSPGSSAMSADSGVSWTQKLIVPADNTWVGASYGNGTFLALNQNSAMAATMVPAGVTTTMYTVPASTSSVLTSLLITNMQTTAQVAVTIDGFTIVPLTSIATFGALDLRLKEVIPTGKVLSIMTTSPVGVHASGVEIT